MRPTARLAFVLLAAILLAPSMLAAHFTLVSPASWLMEDQRGDPQKMAPCGGTSANAGTPTGTVTKVQGGSTLRVAVKETIFHPGHYRIALAVNSRGELPKDPDVQTRQTDRGEWSTTATIMNPVAPPVLADGLWAHTDRAAIESPFETDIVLPNIDCEKCTLQIIQFMAEHGRNRDGDFSYHHCADLSIAADTTKPIDTRWPGQKK